MFVGSWSGLGEVIRIAGESGTSGTPKHRYPAHTGNNVSLFKIPGLHLIISFPDVLIKKKNEIKAAAQSTACHAKMYSDSEIKETTPNNSWIINNMRGAFTSAGEKRECCVDLV